jgi:hypothetical protein
MSGAILLLPLYAFVAWTGAALPLQLLRLYSHIVLVCVTLLILAAGPYVLYLNLPVLLVEHLTSFYLCMFV